MTTAKLFYIVIIYWVFRVYDGGTTTITAGSWHHLALVRNGNNFMIFENGTQLGSTVTDSDAIPDLAGVARLGTSDGTNWPLAGRIDE